MKGDSLYEEPIWTILKPNYMLTEINSTRFFNIALSPPGKKKTLASWLIALAKQCVLFKKPVIV